MSAILNVNHSFNSKGTDKICPRVTSLHSYLKHSMLLSNKITAHAWAIEYHSKYAGRLFLKNLSTSIKREKRTVHLYAPGSRYWEDTNDADLPIQETYLFFTGACECGLDSLVDHEFKFVRFNDSENVIGALFSSAAMCCNNYGDDSFWFVQSCFFRIVHYLISSRHLGGFDYTLSKSTPLPTQGEFSNTVKKFLQKNIGRHVTLSEIAKYMKTSESLLSHRFKKEMGLSPVAYHHKMRIDFAKSLILKGDKLKQIAEMTGYADEYHLSKMFKSVVGVSPRKWKSSQ